MTPEAQRIAIAEACGWTFEHRHGKGTAFAAIVIVFKAGKRHGSHWPESKQLGLDLTQIGIPDYLTDLNAMHEALAQAMFDRSQMQAFLVHLKNQVGPTLESTETLLFWVMMNATAAQRAEAFLRTLGKWEETP